MAKKSLIKLLLCLALLIATVSMATANGPELMVYSGSIPQGVNQGDGSYEISFSIYTSEKGGSALWTETQKVYVFQGTFAVYLGAVKKLDLAFDLPYWVGVKVGDKEDIWPLTGAGYPLDEDGGVASSTGTAGTSLALVADEVLSANIKEADNSSAQNTNSGAGIKTGHIQNGAVTTTKIKKNAVTTPKIADGAVTDAKITGPISASKISSTGLDADTLDGLNSTDFVKKSGDTMTGTLTIKGNGWPNSFLFLDTNAAAQDAGIRFYENGTVKSHLYWDASTGTLKLLADGGAGAKGITIDTSGNVTATSFSGVKKTTCPTGYTQIEFTHSTLCIRRTSGTYNWNDAEDICGNTTFNGGQMCYHQQVRRACKQGAFPLTISTWLADRVDDDKALYVNIANCDNFDGFDAPATGSHNAYCCHEWMKY